MPLNISLKLSASTTSVVVCIGFLVLTNFYGTFGSNYARTKMMLNTASTVESRNRTNAETTRDEEASAIVPEADSDSVPAPKNHQPKVLLFFTTHWPKNHAQFLEGCWPLALQQSTLLNFADVAVFLSSKVDSAIVKEKFDATFSKNTTIYQYKNPGKQQGAMLAMTEAFRLGWFKGYDWVIRVNPDVIIRDDTFILETMKNDADAAGIFVDCNMAKCPEKRNCTNARVQTDFFAIKPDAFVSENPFVNNETNAEQAMTREVQHILHNGQDRWLPHGRPLKRAKCRVTWGGKSEVAHYHKIVSPSWGVKACAAWYKQKGITINNTSTNSSDAVSTTS